MHKLKSVKTWVTALILLYSMFAHQQGKLAGGDFVTLVLFLLPFYFASNVASKFANVKQSVESSIRNYVKKVK